MKGFSRLKESCRRRSTGKAAVCACLTGPVVLIQSWGGTKGWQVKERSRHSQARCSALKLAVLEIPDGWKERCE